MVSYSNSRLLRFEENVRSFERFKRTFHKWPRGDNQGFLLSLETELLDASGVEKKISWPMVTAM